MRCLQDLTTLDLQRNPVTNLPHYREFIVYHLRSLNMLDGEVIKKEERRQADLRFSQGKSFSIKVTSLFFQLKRSFFLTSFKLIASFLICLIYVIGIFLLLSIII